MRAVFLDRDGVIIRERNYLADPRGIRVLRGAPQALKSLRAAGFKIIVATNQSGVARGYFSLAALRKIHAELAARLRRGGAKWDALYFSAHHPDSGHSWRKPGIGMLRAAARRFHLRLEDCYFIGDSTTDMQTARNAGCRAVLVRTGKGGRDGKFPRATPDKSASIWPRPRAGFCAAKANVSFKPRGRY